MREIESVHKLHFMVNKNCLQQVGRVSSRQRRRAVACPVALSSISTKWANLKRGVVAFECDWSSETVPSIHQHELAACHLLSRFSPTNHTAVHFHEESLEKVAVLTFKSHFQEACYKLESCTTSLYYKICWVSRWWAGARCAVWRHAVRVWVGEF